MQRGKSNPVLISILLVLGFMVAEASAQGSGQDPFGGQASSGSSGSLSGGSAQGGEILNAMGFALEKDATVTTTAGVHVFSVQILSAPPQGTSAPPHGTSTPPQGMPTPPQGLSTSTTPPVDVGQGGGQNSGTGSMPSFLGRAFIAGEDYLLVDVQIEAGADLGTGGPSLLAVKAKLVARPGGASSGGSGSGGAGSGGQGHDPGSDPDSGQVTPSFERSQSDGTTPPTGEAPTEAGTLSIRVHSLEGREIVTGAVVLKEVNYSVLATIQHDLKGGTGAARPPANEGGTDSGSNNDNSWSGRGSRRGSNSNNSSGGSSESGSNGNSRSGGAEGRGSHRGPPPQNGGIGGPRGGTQGGEVQSQF